VFTLLETQAIEADSEKKLYLCNDFRFILAGYSGLQASRGDLYRNIYLKKSNLKLHLMKHIIFTVILGLFTALVVHSQNKILFSDQAYLDADEQRYMITEVADVGQPGHDQVWDFSNLKDHGEVISYLKTIAGSPFADKCKNSNILIQEEHRSWLLKASPEGLEEYGSSTGQTVLIYDKPIVRFPFPFEFGASISGEYSGEYLHAPGKKINGRYITEADGFGTLILPDDVVLQDVIRVRFIQQRENGAGFITYRWYASNVDPVLRYPLLSVITSFYNEQTRFVRAAYYADALNLMQQNEPYNEQDKPYEYISINANPYDLRIYPNPFVEFAKIEFSVPQDAHITLQVYDNMGRLISILADKPYASGRYNETFYGNKQFVYFIRLIADDEVISSRKIIQLP
jgi:hypothetical protein